MTVERRAFFCLCCLLGLAASVAGCASSDADRSSTGHVSDVQLTQIGEGWAKTSVNTAVFRQQSIVTHGETQYAAFYDSTAHVVLARRTLGSDDWTTRRTRFMGTVQDAHNAISLGVDGRGVLHVSWDLHGDTLRYTRTVEPGSLELADPMPMTGQHEQAVTYPQFYQLADGDLLFVYRDGSSGDGDVMMNRYDVETEGWTPLQHPLIDGEGERNAYVNTLAIDDEGGWHLSWTWRETWDVATNHDVLYAYSPDEGATWQTSTGKPYDLPITAATAEVVRRVPQNHELINQTTMTVDSEDRPMIVTYWRPEGSDTPQFHLVWHDGDAWRTSQVGARTEPFSLSGGGTKRIPISRPLIVAGDDGAVHVVFRDAERGEGITVATSTDGARAEWQLRTLYDAPVGLWEPTHDPVVWRRDGELHLFVQRVGQGDAETLEDVPPQPVHVLAWTP